MRVKNILTTVLFAVFLSVFSILCFLKPQGEFSESERRELNKMPEVNVETIFEGSFMTDFETYTTDQIPFRDSLRKLKANFVVNVLNKKDNNSLFMAEGHISKLEYPKNEQMMDYAAEKFNYIYNKYLKDKDVNIYLSIVPDKNCYIAEENGYLSMDYNEFIDEFKAKCNYMNYIDIIHLLDGDDYYKTDTHWKMENIIHVAETLAESMGADAKTEYEELTLDKPFYGVYAGQSALNVKPDTITYLTNKTLENATVTFYDEYGVKEVDIYNMDKAYGKDPYEMFLSGSTPLCVIENPVANTDKELILFRDSFGSSIAPLLVEGYSKVTVIDIRYIQSDFLGGLVDFEKGDVLFLYSTLLLNNSLALR